MIHRYLAYGQWANRLMHDALAQVPQAVLEAPQPVVFGSILRTAHHILAMAQVWQAHLLGREHGHATRSPQVCLPLQEIAEQQARIDQWAMDYAAAISPEALGELVPFTFIGGPDAAMHRADMLMHGVNHATYHRGHIWAMLNAAGHGMPASDMPVFLALKG